MALTVNTPSSKRTVGRVATVLTAPDCSAGRGRQLQASEVKAAAKTYGRPVLQPSNLKSPEFQAALAGYGANLQVVVAFRMLPEAVWNMPRLGFINIHASLLPQYRGVAPINQSVRTIIFIRPLAKSNNLNYRTYAKDVT